MTIKEELGRYIANYIDRNYDDEEGQFAKDLANHIVSKFAISHKRGTTKPKRCPKSELWFPCCRNCSSWYDRYEADAIDKEPLCYCIDHADEMMLKFIEGETDCQYKKYDRYETDK